MQYYLYTFVEDSNYQREDNFLVDYFIYHVRYKMDVHTFCECPILVELYGR